MRKALKNFEGLYGDKQHPFTDGFIHHELLEVRSRRYDWAIDTHLHTDLLQVFFFTSGNGVLLTEQNRVPLNPPCVLIIPTNTLHGFLFEAGMVGEVFTITEGALDAFFKTAPHVLLEVNRLNHLTFRESEPDFVQLVALRDRICAELAGDQLEKERALGFWVQLLWVQLYRLSLASSVFIQKADNRTLGYFQGFQKLIRQSGYQTQSVQEYARELSITTVHLNRVCQSVVGKSALQVVHDYLIGEAKKYLLGTSYSLSEISYLLNFKDPAYFSRLFKKQTGLTPGAFRRQGK
ncbi:helix-turn-helix domain-containing protein [Rudanella paleaurantiibacter]|uniref:Helix-turn-helix domain-containing protein n=1 Tax=Rudanella paleaurantiibacter TaxID=2614655 RepID=A0A7J5TUE0_9BACT|nr:helix-turn-helix domain-containing protein [Rudanella paleaurantiibacter]KAB7727628.1 helix-turn-helix domain-containing protein [Rudanella paleaurantiibacter]